MNCSSCGTGVAPGAKFCGECGAPVDASGSDGPGTSSAPAVTSDASGLACGICSKSYKTERGVRSHLTSVHGIGKPGPDHIVRPGETPVDPSPADGNPFARGASEVSPAPFPPPPPASTSVPGGPSYLPPSPPPPPPPLPPPPGPPASGPPAPSAWQFGAPDPPVSGQVPATAQAWSEAPDATAVAGAPLHLFKEIKSFGTAINGLFALLLVVLLVGLAANVFLYVILPPDEGWRDFAIKVDERLFLILPFQLVLYGLIYTVVVVWLYRACGNQRSFGAEKLHLAPGELLALCFVPVANLFAMKVALADIWRTADTKVVPGDNWRRRPSPRRMNLVWAGPLLVLAVNIGSAILVNNRIEEDGNDFVSTIAEGRFLYARNAISILVGLVVLNSLRRLFFDVSERQHSVMRQLRAGGGKAWQRPSQTQPATSQVHTAT